MSGSQSIDLQTPGRAVSEIELASGLIFAIAHRRSQLAFAGLSAALIAGERDDGVSQYNLE
jgi:hypothetical protein